VDWRLVHIFVIGTGAALLAQDPGVLRGQVTDPSRAAVAGAAITATDPGGNRLTTTTDEGGRRRCYSLL
jgi:hypothetical protein